MVMTILLFAFFIGSLYLCDRIQGAERLNVFDFQKQTIKSFDLDKPMTDSGFWPDNYMPSRIRASDIEMLRQQVAQMREGED